MAVGSGRGASLVESETLPLYRGALGGRGVGGQEFARRASSLVCSNAGCALCRKTRTTSTRARCTCSRKRSRRTRRSVWLRFPPPRSAQPCSLVAVPCPHGHSERADTRCRSCTPLAGADQLPEQQEAALPSQGVRSALQHGSGECEGDVD